VPTGDRKRSSVERDAELVEQKFGPFANVYAETRSEAAEIAGNAAAEEHWQEVAAKVDDDPDQ
jgi:hypothetical protein